MPDRNQNSFVSERMVTLIFDQVKDASTETAKTVGELAEGITELITKVGNTPDETLVIVKKIEDLVKDLQRDSLNIKEKIEKLESIKTDVFNLDKKIIDVGVKIDSVGSKLNSIEIIKNYLENIKENMWKFYTVIAIAFLLGMGLIGIVIYLQHSVTDLTKALEVINTLTKP